MPTVTSEDRTEWGPLLDQVTKDHEGDDVMIEILDQTFGDQAEVERLPFAYTNYDHKDDVVFVAVGGNSPRYPVVLRHLVWHPTQVSVAEDEVAAMRVVDNEGTTTIVSFLRRS